MMPRSRHFASRHVRRHARGLTLVELMLALAITAMIAGAIAGMMAGVSAGVGAKRDSRSVMLRANLAATRLNAYIVPARALLAVEDTRFALWLHDQRPGETVHGSEARWFEYVPATGELIVSYVQYPDDWTEIRKQTEDLPHGCNANWWAVLATLKTRGHIATIVLMDGIEDFFLTCESTPLNSRILGIELTFDLAGAAHVIRLSPVIRVHQPPEA